MTTAYAVFKEAVEAAIQACPLLKDSQTVITKASLQPPRENVVPQPLGSAMRYSLTLPGKRLRPVLLLAGYHLLAEDWQSAMPYAIALEMIHTYSLIHDDLPALDNDNLRRGQPTNHRVFGENMAILAGDGLYSLAMETMLEAALHAPKPDRAIAAMEEIARRAGVRGMIAGQTLDVMLEGATPDAALVEYIHRHKTADLLTAPLVAGLLLAGAEPPQLQAGRDFGQALGLAFQIVDDLLDLTGDEKNLGKQTGMDAQRGKMTWPAVFGIQASQQQARDTLDQAVRSLAIFGDRADFLRTLATDTLTRVT